MARTVLRNGIDRFKWQGPFTKGKFAMAIPNLNVLRALSAKFKTGMQFVFYIRSDEDVTGPI